MTVSGIEVSNLDKSTSPKDNFYRFANGGWLDRNPIPDEYSRWGAFEELNELSNSQLHVILEECRAKAEDPSGADANQIAVGTLFATGMDESACASNSFSPMADVYAAIDAVASPHDIVLLHARLSAEMGVHGGLFAFYSLPDAKRSSWEVACISQSSALGIGDRDFYLLEDKRDIRDAYVAHVRRLLALSGAPCSAEDVAAFLALETALAEQSLSRTERRDPLRIYNKFDDAADLAARVGSGATIPWAAFFVALGLDADGFGAIIVDNPGYFRHLAEALEQTPMATWKVYLRYHATLSMAKFLGPDAEAEHFAFHAQKMTGQKEMKVRWKRVLNAAVGDLLEDPLGMMYTERHFSEKAKNMCLDMVHVLTEVLADRIREVDWMQPGTKEKALAKLARFRPLIGYPDKWDVEDIPALAQELSVEKSYGENVRACNVAHFKRVVKRINKPVDPDRWEMPAYMVNAYFHPYKNVIVFPAAILQPPFLIHPTEDSPHGDPAVNYSAIGAVICHEITHGYDDQGRKFDESGELVDWWTEEDAKEYERRAEKMVKLCEGFEVCGKKLNGKLCLGENIADFGGTKLAFEGLQRHQKKYGTVAEIDGFSAEQRFFLGWASVWRNNIREENALKRVIMDPHAPGEFRANVVQILDEFHKAFGIAEGDKMWCPPDLRCDIW